MKLADVVASWRTADPKHIHPTREHMSEEAYWESGIPQAQLVADLVPGGTVVDFGCGDGRIAIPMSKLGLSVIAMDAAPEMIERLTHNAEVHDVMMVACYVWDGAEPFTWIRPEFDGWDAVNARAVFIHHSHKDVATIVGNLAALIKPGGFLIADWPLGGQHERRDWIDVTTWHQPIRDKIAADNGLELVTEGKTILGASEPSVWVKK